KRPAVGPVPVETVAAVADDDLVRLGAVRGLSPPDIEQAERDALVSDAVEVVELTLRLEVGTARVQTVGADPHRRLADFPVGAGDHVGVFAILSGADLGQ